MYDFDKENIEYVKELLVNNKPFTWYHWTLLIIFLAVGFGVGWLLGVMYG